MKKKNYFQKLAAWVAKEERLPNGERRVLMEKRAVGLNPKSHSHGPCRGGDAVTVKRYQMVNGAGYNEGASMEEDENGPHVLHSDHLALQAKAEKLAEALQGLHDDIDDYQRINQLHGHNNHWMLAARAALASYAKETP